MHVTTGQFMILMLIAMLFGLYAVAFGQSSGLTCQRVVRFPAQVNPDGSRECVFTETCQERLYAMLKRVTRDIPRLGELRITESVHRDPEQEALSRLEGIREEKRRQAEIDTLLAECAPKEP